MSIDGVKGLNFKAYTLFEDSDADLPWLLF